jgi:hypothetical protein
MVCDEKPGMQFETMGAYLPYLINMKDKKRFESMGCPVARSKLNIMLPGAYKS